VESTMVSTEMSRLQEYVPLHAFRVIYLWRMPLPLLPYPGCAVPAPTHKFEARWAPVATHHGCDMGLVYLAGGG
jgi:hypothetical protein